LATESDRPDQERLVNRNLLRIGMVLAVVLAVVATAGAALASPEAGVYQYVIHRAQGSPAEVATAIAEAAPGAGFEKLAVVPVGSPEGCGFNAAVVAVYQPDFARKTITLNRRTGPFAIVDRINVFEDENGTHVSVVNPRSILRTVLLEDEAHSTLIEEHLADLRQLVLGAVEGEASEQEYGQVRKKGHIGRTMGVVAGGPFDKKVQDLAVVGGKDWREMAGRAEKALRVKGPKWGMSLAYALELPEFELTIFGTTGTPMDAQSFVIVGAGGDGARKDLACPGLAHAGAYPLEIVVTQEGPTIRTRIVESMYRMKMYFEDAGKWAFMKNMGMPGSIESEIQAQVQAAIDTYGR
jgi:hypothetical protein